MKIHIPNSAFLGNIDQFLRSFEKKGGAELEITSNKSWISIHPVVLAMIATLGLAVKLKNKKSKIEFKDLQATSKHYLARMGLFKLLGIKTAISVKEHEPAGRFIPLTKIVNSDELTGFITDMVPLLHTAADHAEAIRYVVSELVRNVFEHSGSVEGAIVCAQYYKKSNSIKIGVADCGVGIKNSIRHAYPAGSDLDAILLALTPGITGTTRKLGGTEANAGAGLFFIKSIAKTNRDFFVIYSGSAMYKLLKTPINKKVRLTPDPSKDRHSIKRGLPCWGGTVVGIDISLDSHQNFDLLLDLIRVAYRKEIKERKKKMYKRAKFI